MKGTLQATDMQQQMLVEDGVATKFQETENYTNMAVTNEGVTVTPEMMVVNEKMVYLSLAVEGYDLQEGKEPCFEFVDVYLGKIPMLKKDGLIWEHLSTMESFLMKKEPISMMTEVHWNLMNKEDWKNILWMKRVKWNMSW